VTKQPDPPQPTRRYLAYAAGAVFIVIVGVSLFLLGQQRRSETTPDVTIRLEDPGVVDVRTGAAILFFVAEGGMALVPHEQQVEIDAVDDSLTRARVILEHQLGEAPAPLASPFPEGTELRAVYLTPSGDAFVDLNREVTREHGGGSLDELFTVYALVNALTTNMPEISAVQILIEGREVDTLAGHIDLRHPLQRNMKWVARTRRDSESEPTSAEG
jgi:spore germination protein GerM